jgi:uncharacterized membrane protein YphA (DoxX/SURF4 family)
MEANTGEGAKTIAMVRIATGVIFLFFGEYKISGPQWAYGGFEGWIHGFLNDGAPVGFYRSFLVQFVLVHPVLCARLVGWGEFAIGLSLVSGLFVRAASVGGAMEMISLALSTWFEPGHGVRVWRYFGANADHIALLFLFAIFFGTSAGEVWGLDGRFRNRKAGRLAGQRGEANAGTT